MCGLSALSYIQKAGTGWEEDASRGTSDGDQDGLFDGAAAGALYQDELKVAALFKVHVSDLPLKLQRLRRDYTASQRASGGTFDKAPEP
jgi:hypothetical protein